MNGEFSAITYYFFFKLTKIMFFKMHFNSPARFELSTMQKSNITILIALNMIQSENLLLH